ncbi:uncharacterized protein EAF01_005439 [Botrytis porri]|uniref:Uncharacterized protein n=1 Tax=Botrytis porri TaxID=87229 RepID=A0A4Z1KKV8_9HELO|nr:uncharacterized protein EAF01_005439 [Botrytis porri]KAF7904917.1 hypothetical protein EAF01_005439 [Botrytis porri]TGO84882.1 hypothetical protein BPOR_0455g00080 [Botrytis porri]
MSTPHGFLQLTILESSSNYFIYFPVEKDKGKDIRRLIAFKESEVKLGIADHVTPEPGERFKCLIKVGTKSEHLMHERENYRKYFFERHQPKNKMNHMMNVWASKGWVFDIKGKPLPSSLSGPPEQSKEKRLPSSLPAPSNQSGTNTDAPKNPKEKKKLFGNTFPSKEEIAQWKASNKASDSKPASDPLPNSSNPTITDGKSKLNFKIPSEEESLFVSEGEDTDWKSAAGDRAKKAREERDRAAQGKKPIRNPPTEKSFSSDEDNDSPPFKPRSRPSTTRTGKTREPTKPTKKMTTNTNPVGDNSNAGEGGRTAKAHERRRSRSPDRSLKKPAVLHQRGESTHASSHTKKGVAVKIGSSSHNKSVGKSESGRETRVKKMKDPNPPPTLMQIADMDLDDAENEWAKKHRTPF